MVYDYYKHMKVTMGNLLSLCVSPRELILNSICNPAGERFTLYYSVMYL